MTGKCPLTPPCAWGQGAQLKRCFLSGKPRPEAGGFTFLLRHPLPFIRVTTSFDNPSKKKLDYDYN
ncbi:MAG: hypothetical protein A2169_12150 [Deltaproteobacteria bacterium RBG_13_47_9]|nr:MAG: hypothetical protein A2169_12150 [Deltaproteobacteria bacterium RBG_13_47_9]